MDAKVFGSFIAQVRRENDLTQAELTAKLGVTDKAVSRWERGLGFPDIATIEPLARALGLSVPELMRSQRAGADDAPDDLTAMMQQAVDMQRENARQDRFALILGGPVLLLAAAGAYLTGRASMMAALLLGAMAALVVIAAFYLQRSAADPVGRRVYACAFLAGAGLLLALLSLLGIAQTVLSWGTFAVLGAGMVIAAQ